MTADYLTVLDPFPQQYDDATQLWPFYERLRAGELCTTRCGDCGAVHWPPRSVCPACMADGLGWEAFPPRGTVYSYTVQRTGVPSGFTPPLVYALIDFDNGLRLFSALVDCRPEDVRSGMEVEPVIRDVAPDQLGRRRVLPFFRPVPAA